jgi:hypothetical protein
VELAKRFLQLDHSNYGEPLLFKDDRRIIDSLVAIDVEQIKQNVIDRKRKAAEGTEGSHFLGFALVRYQSKMLDKLVKQRFKLFWARISSDK